MKYLKMFPIVHTIPLNALDQPPEIPPSWTWTQSYPNTISIREKQLMETLQFVLTGFVDRSTSLHQRESRHERTYFVKYVVPILQTFGQQNDCLNFQWCEVQLTFLMR
ncbi:uncharacterized protein RHIMIDRAFT_232364 [Rhizopus microsporus ATCC 52813]|uniref:Uncharacterized protein n=1 Tax=Rhizopus microsporus ATCC 52813 TaxID=1340429 RepID=A0A2G4T7E1_RHIZD|nr:uncharacterized protein RHIMIDRAFT_232364 [Rhizopus microsporus ATCC 52813]PHZ16918.1 hypothetical protein RHIMIDRAFT_232364 [Rhizopus microsporus ATCC 52813]